MCVCVCVWRGERVSWSVQVGNLSSAVHPHPETQPIVPLCGSLCGEPLWRGRGRPLLCLGLLCSDKEPVYEPPPCPNSRLTDWLTDWPGVWLTDCLAGWLSGWLTDWTADWVSVCVTWCIGWRQERWKCVFEEISNQQHTLALASSNQILSANYF